MTLWADIETADGSQRWRVREIQQVSENSKVNRGDGKFDFNIPLHARNADQIQEERIITVYDRLGEFCSGYITSVNFKNSGESPGFRVGGEDLMRELKWQRLDMVRVADTEWLDEPPRYHEHDFNTGWTSNRWAFLIAQYGRATCALNFGRAIYIGTKSPPRSVRITLNGTTDYDKNSLSVGAFYIERFNGVQWDQVEGLGYTGNPVPLSVLVTTFTWTFAEDTRALLHDSENNPWNDREAYFWIRMWPNQQMQNANIAQVEVLVDAPTTDDVTDIMAEATGGWSLSGSYASGTADGTMQEFRGDSVLSALVQTVEKATGEMFRKGTGRVIEWLNAAEDLGLRAVGGRGIYPSGIVENADAVLITSIDDSTDSTSIVTRIYPFGRGTGSGRPDLSQVRASVASAILTPYGFTLDAENNCIINTSLETSLGGQRPLEESFRDIGPMYSAGENNPQVSEEILKKAAALLYERRQAKRTVKLSVTALNRKIKVGELLTLRYIEGFKRILNEQYTVVEVKNNIDRPGNRTADLVLSNYNRPEEQPFDFIAKEIRNNRYAERFDQAVFGHAVKGAPPQVLG